MGGLVLECKRCRMQFSQQDALGKAHVSCPICRGPLQSIQHSSNASPVGTLTPLRPSYESDAASQFRLACYLIAGPVLALPVSIGFTVYRIQAAGGVASAWTLGGIIGSILGGIVSIILGVILIRKSGM
jgi:hypothetical protein